MDADPPKGRAAEPPTFQETSSFQEASTFQEELRTLIFLTVVTAPLIAVLVVGGYGFLVWMYQLFTGDLPG